MMRALAYVMLFIGVTVAIAFGAVLLLQVRVIVVKPLGAIPDGVTIMVAGVPGMNLIDSPDAFCMRKSGGVTLLCRLAVLSEVASNGKIIARLPYMSMLDVIANTPENTR